MTLMTYCYIDNEKHLSMVELFGQRSGAIWAKKWSYLGKEVELFPVFEPRKEN
jgi:hypothetical protein